MSSTEAGSKIQLLVRLAVCIQDTHKAVTQAISPLGCHISTVGERVPQRVGESCALPRHPSSGSLLLTHVKGLEPIHIAFCRIPLWQFRIRMLSNLSPSRGTDSWQRWLHPCCSWTVVLGGPYSAWLKVWVAACVPAQRAQQSQLPLLRYFSMLACDQGKIKG